MLRTTAQHVLSWDQFEESFVDGNNALIFTEKIGNTEGASKTQRGGWKSAG